MTDQTTRDLLATQLTEVNELLRRRLHSKVPLVDQIAEHIISSGGKRIRPVLVLLAAHALHATGDQPIQLAAIIELIHTATLLHDDVVDNSLLRRGLDTANALWGPAPSVLVGDFLYSRAFQMMVQLNNIHIMEILANTTNTIAEGEVLQLMNAGNPDTTELQYLDVIRYKTAELFKAATQLGALASGASNSVCQGLAQYGLHLGMAYQIADDLLDYTADAELTGKNVGADLAEGKPTLPLIYLIKHGSEEERHLIQTAIRDKSTDNLALIQTALAKSNALDYCRGCAKRESELAINSLKDLDDSIYKTRLIELAQFAYKRSY